MQIVKVNNGVPMGIRPSPKDRTLPAANILISTQLNAIYQIEIECDTGWNVHFSSLIQPPNWYQTVTIDLHVKTQ